MLWIYSVLSNSRNRHSLRAGFGLIELLVSISILTIVMGAIMAQQNSYNGAVLLRSQAYDLALSIREVQLATVSVQGFAGDYRTNLGIYFDLDTSSLYGDRQAFHVYRDNSSPNIYDPVEKYGVQGNLDKRFEISEIRNENGNSIEQLSIIFQRPNFDAKFYNTSGDEINSQFVEIDVSEIGGGAVRTVEVTKTGQISVQNI
ncbi:prepilin-type N-terminal cleavage/methylation domain-containing protein [Candidatus Kaiserbacteria bacterium]|nr:prepilin-type N-terminal cleavage/methylation domain-containing protein [Candidatus Kaiserbacteria bacterium]